jgi:hypothetical protein
MKVYNLELRHLLQIVTEIHADKEACTGDIQLTENIDLSPYVTIPISRSLNLFIQRTSKRIM